MSNTPDQTQKNQQPKRQFRIPTVEDIERNRQDIERRLAPAENMRQVGIDLSTSILGEPQVTSLATETTAPPNPVTAPPTNNTAGTGATGSGPTYNSQIVLVNVVQRGNPLLECIRNVRWSHSKDITPDFVVGSSSCVLFLSIKYHRLHPEYIGKRIEDLGRSFRVRVLLVHVDTDDSKIPLREINRTALLGNMTILLAWSLDEAGRYIESLKTFENRQPDIIRERVDDSYMAKLANTLTSVRSVNNTDVLTLASNFGSFKSISNATVDELTMCPGIGELKAQRLFKALNEPFIPEKD